MILGLFTGLTAPGGVQRISQHTAAVLTSLAKEKNTSCRILGLNDPVGQHQINVNGIDFVVQGFGGNKIRFVLKALVVGAITNQIYISHPNLSHIGLLMRKLFLRPKYWVAAHGIEVWKPLPKHLRLGLGNAELVTAPSNFTAAKLAQAQGLSGKKIVVLPWALDPTFHDKTNDCNKYQPDIPGGKILLTVARLSSYERYKGIDDVIKAMPHIIKLVPDAYYIIVGDGDDRNRLERLTEENNISRRVCFVGGGIQDKMLAAYYRSCDIFVMPSKGEGFGLVYLEAMAFGKPIVACNEGGAPDVIVDGETGFLVEYGDVDALGNKIVELLGDPLVSQRMGEAGKERVSQNYTFEHFEKRLVEIIAGG